MTTISDPTATTTDLDLDPLEQLDEDRYAAMLASGSHTPAQIAILRQNKLHRNDIGLCKQILKLKGWESSPHLTKSDIILNYAKALEGLVRRPEALLLLRKNRALSPVIEVALAKLLFKNNDNKKAKQIALIVCSKYRSQVLGAEAPHDAFYEPSNSDAENEYDDGYESSCSSSSEGGTSIKSSPLVSLSDASDAFYLLGWINIHSDDHSSAYKVWSDGHVLLPDDPILSRQYQKRVCWDNMSNADDLNQIQDLNIIGSVKPDLDLDLDLDLEAFQIPVELREKTPALAVYDQDVQYHNLVFRTKNPILSVEECKNILDIVDDYIATTPTKKWSTVRQSSVRTTDIAVEDIPTLRPWLRLLLKNTLFPLVASAYPKLADGSAIIDEKTGGNRMRVHDAFIVRYDEADESLSLPEHSDTSAVSFTVSLNGAEGEFEGGGTWFESLAESTGLVIDSPCGCATMFAGPLRHAGFPISKGTRVILVLFLYIEGYRYGGFVRDYCIKFKDCGGAVTAVTKDEGLVKSSGDKVGGFVVYRQTVELANMLGRDNGGGSMYD